MSETRDLHKKLPMPSARIARYRCTTCSKIQDFEYSTINGREPDTAELDSMMRQTHKWLINAYCWGEKRATCCSNECATAYLDALSATPHPSPTAPARREREDDVQIGLGL